MKKVFQVAAVSAALMMSLSASALSVGTIDMESVVTKSPQAKKIKSEMEAKFGPDREKVMALGKSLQADIQEYQKNQSVMNKKDLDALQKKISDEQSQLREIQGKVQAELSKEQNAKMDEFMKDVKTATQKVAEKEKMDLVLPARSVIYVSEDSDITQKVIDAM